MATPIFWLSVHIKLVREEDTRCVSKNICISVLLRMQGHNLRRLKWTLWLLFSIDEGEARWTWNLRLIARVRAGNFTVQTLLHPGVQTENGELLENLLATCDELAFHSSGNTVLLLFALYHWIWNYMSTGMSRQAWKIFYPSTKCCYHTQLDSILLRIYFVKDAFSFRVEVNLVVDLLLSVGHGCPTYFFPTLTSAGLRSTV